MYLCNIYFICRCAIIYVISCSSESSGIDFFHQLNSTIHSYISKNSNTSIDQILSNNLEESKKSKSGILINDISDHKMIFTFIENIAFIEKFDKLIKIEQKGEIAIPKCIEELKSMKIFLMN